MQRSSRIAVIGGTGFLGSHLAEHLVSQGHEVLILARSLRRAEFLCSHERLSFAAADITDRPSIQAALRAFAPEVVYHLACESDGAETVDHMQACIESNAIGTMNALQASIAAGAGLFVFADSSKVYGNGPVPYRADQPENPICSYAVAKAAGWRLCTLLAAKSEVKLVGLRPTFIYGPRQNFNLLSYIEQSVRRGQAIRIQGGKQTRDLLYVDDAVRCFTSVMHAPATWGKSLPIGGGEEVNVGQLCREILDALGSELEVAEDSLAARPTEIWRSFCDNEDIRRYAGWTPQISLKEGLRRTFFSDYSPREKLRRLETVSA